jgi:hypothetical protein
MRARRPEESDGRSVFDADCTGRTGLLGVEGSIEEFVRRIRVVVEHEVVVELEHLGGAADALAV